MLQTIAIAFLTATVAQGETPKSEPKDEAYETLLLAQTRTTAPKRTNPDRAAPKRVSPQRAVVRATPAQIINFHDPESTGWYFRYGLSSDGYKKAWDKYKADGYLPIDIETDRVGGKTRYSGVWQKNKDKRGWASFRNLTSDGFHQRWAEYRDKGYRPIDQDTAVVNGAVRYSLIMVENKEGLKWVSNRNLTSAEFSEKFNQYKGAYMPIDVDATNVNGTMRYSIIWVENKSNKGWVELRDMTPATYGEKFKQYRDQGYRVSDLDCYANKNGKLRYAAIWEKNKAGRAWAARREMSATGLKNWWKKYADQGMRVIDIEICPANNGSGVRYAAVWRENDERYDWSGRQTVEQAMKNYVDNSDAPSVGVAIMRNGEMLFRGGAGEADTQKGVWAHGGTIYRHGSISKPITGVLAYDMEEAGIIDLDDDTRDLVSGLGSNHTHTVRQLVRMEACVAHYQSDGLDDNGTQTTYSTALSALNNHIGGAIKTNSFMRSGCTIPTYNYSTHSYVLAGAALEAEGGMSYANLVKTRIADPFNLNTLRVESRTSPDPSGELAEIYGNGARVSDANFQNITWKAGGGGTESSAIDLARFGDLVLRNRYFPQATRDAMWVGSNNGQGGGWGVTGVQRWKPGGQQGSDTYIVIDVNTGTTVVALVNKSSASIDATTLANQILGIANAN